MDSTLDQFKATFRDMKERLGKALDIAGPLMGEQWSWSGDFDIGGDAIEAEMYRYFYGEEEIQHVSFPLHWLWGGGPDGDLAVTFAKGNAYQHALDAKAKAESDARKKHDRDKHERRELIRLQVKFGIVPAEEKGEEND